MPSAEIITIGTELLLGEIVDTNSTYLTRHLRDLNVDIYRTSTIGDNVQRIAEIVQETLKRARIIITTGGLGPTVDDPTREAIAVAFQTKLEYRADLWEQISERMSRYGRAPTENQKRQAFIPEGATPIKNDVGTAPAFFIEKENRCLIALPGVPLEMEYLAEQFVFPYLRERYQLKGIIKARILHTTGLGEGMIDDKIGDLEMLTNPTVGLAAHYGKVDIRITAKAESALAADDMIATIEQDIRQRLGKVVYGTDFQTLESVVIDALQARDWKLVTLELNTDGTLTRKLGSTGTDRFLSGKIIPGNQETSNLENWLKNEIDAHNAEVGIAISVKEETGKSELELLIITPKGQTFEKRGYGGHPKNAQEWGANSALQLLRSLLI